MFKRVKGRSRRRKGKEKGKRERKREEIEKDPTCGEVFGLLLLLEETRGWVGECGWGVRRSI